MYTNQYIHQSKPIINHLVYVHQSIYTPIKTNHKPLGLCTPINKTTKYVSISRVVHISYTPAKKVPNTFYFLFLKEFSTRFLLHYVLSF